MITLDGEQECSVCGSGTHRESVVVCLDCAGCGVWCDSCGCMPCECGDPEAKPVRCPTCEGLGVEETCGRVVYGGEPGPTAPPTAPDRR